MIEPFYQCDRVSLYQGDCLQVMPQLEPQSFDCILSDPPFGITNCTWDTIIPFESLWGNYKRLIKPNGAIVLFASQPFTSMLVMSNTEWFKYCWVWSKNMCSGFLDAKKKPLKQHEDIVVFYSKQPTYNPQKTLRTESELKRLSKTSVQTKGAEIYAKNWGKTRNRFDDIEKYPASILNFTAVQNQSKEKVGHSSQKPIALMRYLVRTYTNPGDRVLDNTAGSFSTGVAAVMEGRNFVGIEQDEGYCNIGKQRITDALTEVDSMLIKPWELQATQQGASHEQIELFGGAT